jgi:hypothetical protein
MRLRELHRRLELDYIVHFGESGVLPDPGTENRAFDQTALVFDPGYWLSSFDSRCS